MLVVFGAGMMRSTLATMAVLSLAFGADAVAQSARLTTHDVASCRTEADLAICLLGVEARSNSFRDKPAFAHAPEVLAQLDRWAPQTPDRESALERSYYEASTRPFRELQAVVISALEADRGGAEPAAALERLTSFGRDLQSQTFAMGQIVTANGAELRVIGYEQIWDGYALSIGRGGRAAEPISPPPSRALAIAVLAAWERDLPAARAGRRVPASALRLAEAFAAVGDLDAVERLSTLEPGLASVLRLEALVTAGRLEDAAEIATADTNATGVADHRLWLQTWRLIEAAQASNRRDLAARVARHVLETTRRHQEDFPRAAIVIATAGAESDALATMEDLDRRARGTPTYDAATTAVAAVAGWTAMGRTTRADALIRLWRPRGLAWPSNHSCGPVWALCHDATVVQMLRRANRLQEGFDGLHLTAETAIAVDLSDGHGLSRLEEFLIHEQTPQGRERALGRCVEWAIENDALPVATSCARQLRMSATSRLLSDAEGEQVARFGDATAVTSGPFGGAQRCLEVAAAAAQRGEMELSREMISCAMDLWASVPPVRWGPVNTIWTTRVGSALLREQGRL